VVAAIAQPEVRYRLYPIQDDFVADQHRYVAFIGGRGSGKTYSGSVKAVLKAMDGGLGCIAAPNFPMLENGAKRAFIDRLRELDVAYKLNGQTGVMTIPDWNAEIIFATLESESRVRGPNFSWAWPDELEYLYDRQIWQALKGAVRAGPYPQIFATTTPKGKRLVYDEWVAGDDEHHQLYRATTFDNLFINAADYVSGLGYEGDYYEQEINADFVSFEGLVYARFDRLRNVQTVDCDGWETLLTMDVGSNNPTVILTLRHAGDRLHIEREVYRRGMSSDDITDAAASEYQRAKPTHMVIDPSAKGLSMSLQARGVKTRRGINDIIIGITRVTSTLPHLTIDPSCTSTINEFETYQYPDKKRGESDVPQKANDHCLIAGTLVETSTGTQRIEEIVAGQWVWTRKGLRPVVAAGLTNPSVTVYRLETSDGSTLIGSALHPVWTQNRGWIMLDALRYGDIIEAWQNESKASSSTTSHSVATRTQRAGLIAPITYRAVSIASMALAACTRKCGRLRTAISLPVARFTTWMATHPTTTSAIFSASPSQSIALTTGELDRCTLTRFDGLKRIDPRPLNGTDRLKDWHGIRSMANALGKAGTLTRRPVSNVAPPIGHATLAALTDSARTSASPSGDGTAALMMSRAPVCNAVRRSASTDTAMLEPAPVRVLSVTVEPTKQAVYNLTVAQVPEFYANGILVHNSMDALRYGVMDLYGKPQRPDITPTHSTQPSNWR
jgi:phage terminase large subunit